VFSKFIDIKFYYKWNTILCYRFEAKDDYFCYDIYKVLILLKETYLKKY